MKQNTNVPPRESTLQNLRNNFSYLHMPALPAFEKEIASLKKSIAAQSGNKYYEELQTVSYNPDFQTLEAIFAVKQAAGYNGNLCSNGSYGFVRFYLDYGKGWLDQGYTAVKEYDIPTGYDCTKSAEKPLHYAASLVIKPQTNFCGTHVLPKVRAILDWNTVPPANSPDFIPIWGNAMDDHVQIKPRKLIIFENAELSKVLEVAIENPHLSIWQAAQVTEGGDVALQQTTVASAPESLNLKSSIEYYQKTDVSPARYGLKDVVMAMEKFDASEMSETISTFNQYKIDWQNILGELQKTNANVSYEQIENVGLDINRDRFVASFRVKRALGYGGDLCKTGSTEYVAFWVDWGNNCKWEYAGTAAVNVHDINDIPAGGLSYAALLPYDFTHKIKECSNPNVVKLRAVLSWNVAPSTTDPEKLNYYGNRMDTYVQIKTGIEIPEGSVIPYFYVLGGIPVDKINNGSGLTLSGATFALNAIPVEGGAPFAGVVVIQGPSYPGYYYRIKVTNLTNPQSHYLNDPLWLVGYHQNPLPPHNTYKTINPDANGYYAFQSKGSDYDDNIDNVLARWSPGGNEKWLIELEIFGVAGTFSKVIQMDNTAPVALINLDDNGDCTHFHKGQAITGNFTASDNYISRYALSTNFLSGGTIAAGTSNTINQAFSFTPNVATPCGSVSLAVYEKTIHNSVTTGYYTPAYEIVCLQS
jgi:hypothetical protein